MNSKFIPSKGDLVQVSDDSISWITGVFSGMSNFNFYKTDDITFWTYCRPHSTRLNWETGSIPDGTGLVLIDDGKAYAYTMLIKYGRHAPECVRWCKLPVEDD